MGGWRLNGEADLASPTGSGGRLTASVTHTGDDLLNFGVLNDSPPLGPAGGKLSASYNQSRYHLTGAFSLQRFFAPDPPFFLGSLFDSG